MVKTQCIASQQSRFTALHLPAAGRLAMTNKKTKLNISPPRAGRHLYKISKMKNIITLIITALIISACGSDKVKTVEDIISEGNLTKIREKRSLVDAEQQAISLQLKQLDAAISKLDSVKKLPLITTFKAKAQRFEHFIELQGNVKTKQDIILYPEYSGTLKKVYVKEGQRVSKGQLLALIDDNGLGQQLAQLKVKEVLAKTTFERQERLWNKKIGSEIQYLQAKTNYSALTKAINQMQAQLAKTNIKAPFSGIIDDVISEQGTVVVQGVTHVLRIINLKNMYIEVEVPETYLNNITKGKTVEVYFPAIDKRVSTKIRQVGNYINPNNRSFKIEIGLSNSSGQIKPNLTARLKINDYTNENALLIPQSIISENAEGQQYIYLVIDILNNKGKSKRVIVKTGKTQGDVIEILEGIKNDDQIIDEGARSVKDGQPIEIIKQ